MIRRLSLRALTRGSLPRHACALGRSASAWQHRRAGLLAALCRRRLAAAAGGEGADTVEEFPAEDAPLSSVRRYLQAKLSTDLALFRAAMVDGMTEDEFVRFIQLVAPRSGRPGGDDPQGARQRDDFVVRSLFRSMGSSWDGRVHHHDLCRKQFLMLLRSLLNRPDSWDTHPVSASFHCLPTPPFRHDDPTQLRALRAIEEVHDAVVGDWRENGWQPKELILRALPRSLFVGLWRSSAMRRYRWKKRDRVRVESRFEEPEATVPEGLEAEALCHKGLWLHGDPGKGKRLLTSMFLRSLPPDFPVLRINYHRLAFDMWRTRKQGAVHPRQLYDVFATSVAQRCSTLVMDGVAVLDHQEALQLKELFSALWARGVTVVCTSLFRQEDLLYNQDAFRRFAPKLAKWCPELCIDSKDSCGARSPYFVDSGNFLSPPSAENVRRMDERLAEILGPKGVAVERDARVEIAAAGHRRIIRAERLSSSSRELRVAHFDWESLCGSRLGRSAYSAIAKRFHHIFLSAVPRLCHARQQEYKNFCTFVDRAYEKKAMLYILSEVPVEDIYDVDGMDISEMDVQFRFQRNQRLLTAMRCERYASMVWLCRNHFVRDRDV